MQIVDFVKGKTNKICLIGNPVAHSISPEIHNTLNRELNIDNVYLAFKIDIKNFEEGINGIKALGIKGFNITVPYKNRIIEFLDNISDEAKFLGSVNTVNIKDNILYGYSTDGEGFIKAFKLEADTDFKNKNITIIGAGGTTRAILGKLAFEEVNSINIFNRTYEKAEKLASLINNYSKTEIAKSFFIKDENIDVMAKSDIIINTTSVGMHPNVDESLIKDINVFNKKQIVYDVIYNPNKTKFLKMAESKGCRIINGFGMLVFQGIASYEIWNDIKIDDKISLELLKSLKLKYNLVGK